MSPILDPNGQPLPPTRPVAIPADLLEAICKHHDKAGDWSKVNQRFEALLSWLEPNAPLLHGVLTGQAALDARTQEGQNLTRFCFDTAMMALVLRKREQRISDERNEAVAENGGMTVDGPPIGEDGDEAAGG